MNQPFLLFLLFCFLTNSCWATVSSQPVQTQLVAATTELEQENEHEHEHGDETSPPDSEGHQEKLQLSPQQISNAGLVLSTAGPALLQQKLPLFGVLSIPSNKQYRLNAPYVGLIEQVLVEVGDQVRAGQQLARVRNSNTLQSYPLLAPASGVISQRWLNPGDLASSPLLEISDDSQLWFDMSVFPTDASQLRLEQPLQLQDLDQPQAATVQTQVNYIAPQLSMGHITRARATLPSSGLPKHWRAGMHLQAWLTVAQQEVAVAVPQSALQQLAGKTVLFVQQGQEFIATEVELGLVAPPLVEIRHGLAAGSRYVSQQSFVLKAELGKASAGHNH